MKRPSDVMRALALLAFLAIPGALVAQDAAVEGSTARTPGEAVSQEKEARTNEMNEIRMRVEDAEQNQYSFLKRMERLINATGTRLNGTGRVLFLNEQSYGSHAVLPRSNRGFDALLDLDVNGVVSREIKYQGLFRLRSDLLPSLSANSFTVQRVRMELNPTWFSAVVGDFDESYTPFTLWNRNVEDYVWQPTFLKRGWDIAKTERFIGLEPVFPMRGLKIGTALAWPDSNVMDRFQVSTFGHYARNSFTTNATYDGFTALVGGATAELIFKGGASLKAYGLLYDQPDWSHPEVRYDRANPSTWAHNYRVGSLKPKIERRVYKRIMAGVEGEVAFAQYRADKRDLSRDSRDYALTGGPYFRWSAGRIQFNVLETGNSFYSPLAQVRQRDDRTGSILTHPVLTALPGPNGFFAYYSRLDDNVFPYGLSTPNRQGWGADFDMKFFDRNVLKLKGSAWAVHEYSGNYVATTGRDNIAPVDAPMDQENPLRDFIYVNVAPRIDLAPLAGFKRDLEILMNIRSERTKSDTFGELKSDKLSGGLKAGILPGWWLEPAAHLMTAKGHEAMIDGSYARTPYRFDNVDLGRYAATEVDVRSIVMGVSSTVEAGPNSKFLLDLANRKREDRLNEVKVNDNSVFFGYEVVF